MLMYLSPSLNRIWVVYILLKKKLYISFCQALAHLFFTFFTSKKRWHCLKYFNVQNFKDDVLMSTLTDFTGTDP